MCVYIYIYMYMIVSYFCIHIYIYIEREREREMIGLPDAGGARALPAAGARRQESNQTSNLQSYNK